MVLQGLPVVAPRRPSALRTARSACRWSRAERPALVASSSRRSGAAVMAPHRRDEGVSALVAVDRGACREIRAVEAFQELDVARTLRRGPARL